MKKLISIITVFCLLFYLTACGTGSGTNSNTEPSATQPQAEAPDAPGDDPVEGSGPAAEPTEEASKTLVVYFSATGNTKAVAEEIVWLTGANLYEIVPTAPYTDEDLNYNNDDCRANQEMNNASVRPAISGSVDNMDDYDVVFLGYPIWWGQAPRIISTFLESYDFDGKAIVPFCTSASSGIGSSATDLHDLAPNADWLSGQRFSNSTNQSMVQDWVDGLELPSTAS